MGQQHLPPENQGCLLTAEAYAPELHPLTGLHFTANNSFSGSTFIRVVARQQQMHILSKGHT